jgi:hypothetical protein
VTDYFPPASFLRLSSFFYLRRRLFIIIYHHFPGGWRKNA